MAAPSIRMAAINKMMDDIRYKSQILARTNKVMSAISGNGLIGLAIGIIVALAFVLIPVVILGGVF
ncbi:MAG TPA: tetrahydromethanopterin S-methyltransferase subunit F [Methanocorpusculum sp.]|nr:tetrahydromethanopterin S-methyltransferase subunit F [Methanocorpusculum sp.]